MILCGDVREMLATLPDESVNCVVTSPPYWGLRDYGTPGQLGLEPTPEEYVASMVAVFREVRRVLRADGTLWLNLGDSYAGSRTGEQGVNGQMADREVSKHRGRIADTKIAPDLKPKDLVGIPWRVAFALQADGWWLRSDVIWSKPNPMPESVTDRPTKAHEYVFLLSKSARYWYDAEAIKEPAIHEGRIVKATGEDAQNNQKGEHGRTASGFTNHDTLVTNRNKRTVWTVATQPYSEAHFATFPEELIKPCVLAGCPEGGTVLDPFFGSGTTGVVAYKNRRKYIGVELNPEYVKLAEKRLAPLLAQPHLL